MYDKTYNIFKQLWEHISLKRRKQLYIVLFLTIISSISEIICLTVILPFIGAITNPDSLLNYSFIVHIKHTLNITSTSDLILTLAIVFAICVLLAGSLRLLLIWTSLKVANATGTDLSIDIYKKTLYQPYKTHIARSSSDIISTIAQKSMATTNVMISLVTFTTTSILFFAITCAMLVINAKITITSALIITCSYLTIAKFTKRNLAENGQIISNKQNEVILSLQEGLGAIRDIILDGSQENYANSYKKPAEQLQKSRAENMFIGQSPRYIIETFAMILIALFVLITTKNNGNIINSLPILGFFALSAQRLLPLIQQMYGYWSEIIGNKAALADVLSLLNQPLNTDVYKQNTPIKFNKKIQLANVSFQYNQNTPFILNNVNLTIPKGARIGIIGTTGSGKSTMLDILMGLIEPSKGSLLVDETEINMHNQRAWQKNIAHVPQVIFLANLTIAENIAFGIPKNAINMDKVISAAIKANAHNFISQCEMGYDTLVGERGIRLSGGQRQRIGIARALYKNASVLCFDEATSALDNSTEQDVMSAINDLDESLTIIIIAHRLTTLKKCSHFIKISKEEVKFLDSYNQVTLEAAS